MAGSKPFPPPAQTLPSSLSSSPCSRKKALPRVGKRLFACMSYPHRAVSMGMICFFRDMTPGRNTRLSLALTVKACWMVSSLPT